MKYYIMRQDHRMHNYPKLMNLPKLESLWEHHSALYCPAAYYNDCIGFFPLPFINITNLCLIISEEMARIFNAYQMGSRQRLFATDAPHNEIVYYYFYQPPILDCLHETCQFNKNETIKKLVLSKQKIGPHKVFQPAWILERYLIIDMEILELLLSSSIYPFLFEEVDVK